jgi:hypothetical protein
MRNSSGRMNAGELHEIADGDLVDASGAWIGDVVEPLDLRRNVCEALKLGGGEAPLGWSDWGRRLWVGHGLSGL